MSEKSIKSDGENKELSTSVNRRNYLKLASMAGTGFGTGLGASALGEEFSATAQAATTVVDDFSNTNLTGRYDFAERDATTSVTSVSSSVTSGADTNVLQMDGDGTTRMHAYKGDGDTDLNAYPEIGDTFSCWMRGLNGTENVNFIYGAQDANNKYYVKLNLSEGYFALFKYVDGSGQSLTGDWSNSTVQSNTGWFEVEIDWTTDHKHTVTLYQNGSQVTSLSYTEDSGDPQFTATGVGYSAYLSSGETAQFDYTTTTGNSSNTCDSSRTCRKIIGDGGDGSNVVDDFEDGDLSEYTHDPTRDGQASVVSSPAIHGSNTLQISDETAELISLPGDGLGTYPSQGDVFTYHIRGDGGADDINLAYGVQDHKNRYFIRVDIANDDLFLFKYENGESTPLDEQSSGFTLNEDKWYIVDVRWEVDGTQTITLSDTGRNQLAQVSNTDSTWSSGGIGYDAYLSDGGTVYIDYVKIRCNERPLTSQELSDAKSRCQSSNQYNVIKQKLESEGYTVDEANATGTYMKMSHLGHECDFLDIPVSGSTDVDMRVADRDSNGEPDVVASGVIDSDTTFWYYSDQQLQDGSENQMLEWHVTEKPWGTW